MSRTNPYKKKRRSAMQTLLMYGEGLSEETFLKYLRSLYAQDSGVKVIIRNGKGGNAVNIVIDASNAPGDFDKKAVILDNDKGDAEMQQARREAIGRGIELIENTPCLEAVLLAILNDGKSYSEKQSNWCKEQFQSIYIEKKKRVDISEYKKFFPKALLDKQRLTVPELRKFISIMEGGAI